MKKLKFLVFVILVISFAGRALAQDELSQGMSLLNKNDCAGALPHLLKAVSSDPKSQKANLYLGNAYLCLGKLDSAELFFSQAIKIDDESAPAFYGLGQVYLQEKKYADAIDNLKSATNYDSKNGTYVIALGRAYLSADSLDSAMKAFYKARDMNDKDPRALEGTGDVYEKQNIFDPAIENYKEALALDSLNIRIRLKLANAYMKNNDGGGAYEQFVEASEIEPNNADAQGQAGELLYINKRYREAFPFLEKYHQLVPNDDKALIHLAESALNGDSYEEAVKYYQEYLKKYPNSLVAKRALAAAYFFGKKPLDSYNAFKTIPIDSLNVKELVRYGLAADAVHDTAATIDAWSRAVKLDTTTLSPIEYRLAGSLFGAKRYDEAIAHFQRHLSLNPDDVTAELNMGLCYIVLKDFANAIVAFKRVTQLKPDYYLGYRWLALAYVYADSADQATDAYQTMIKLALADTSSDHSQELNEAYRSIAAYQLADGGRLQKAEKIDEAKKYYNGALSNLQTALKYDSKNARTHALLADAYALLGKTEEACKEIKATLKLDPKNAEMLKLQKDLSCE